MPSKQVPTVQLGKGGPQVPAMGFGLMGLSNHGYGPAGSYEERFKVLDRALQLGCIFWDTSDLYGDGEELLARWFKRTGKRSEIFLASKFGYVQASGKLGVDSSGEYCRKACEKSLAALGIDYIDLYYAHNVNPETPIEETVRELKKLQDEGKIRHIGLSAISSATLRRAVKVTHIAAEQTEYSLFTRDIEGPEGTYLLPTCRELGVACVASSPLSRGVLTVDFGEGGFTPDATDSRSHFPRFQDANRQHNAEITRRFNELAKRTGRTVSQLSLAWVIKQGVIPIPGTKQIKYLEENWAALDHPLTDEEEAEARALLESVEVAGTITPAAYLSFRYRDTKEESA